MNPVSTAELAQIQSEAASAVCTLPCVIQRKTKVPDGLGQYSEIYTTISPDGLLAGLSQPSAGMLAAYASMIGSLAAWKVQLPWGTNVLRQDHLIIAGNTMVVQVDLSPQSYPGLQTVLAIEIVG